MRNRYPGTCYRCGRYVSKGEGHFELIALPARMSNGFGKWRIHCAQCAITNKLNKAKERNNATK